jgi:hypothetical protein
MQDSAPAPTAPPEEFLPPRKLSEAEKKIIYAAVAQSMKDRGSVQIKWTPFRATKKPDGVADYCMTVNARNSYGGYVGFKPYLTSLVLRQGKVYAAVLQGAGGSYSQEIVDNATISYCKEKALNPFEVE